MNLRLSSRAASSVWPIAHAVCAHLQDAHYFAHDFWKNKRVLELGSGCGIVGVVAAVLVQCPASLECTVAEPEKCARDRRVFLRHVCALFFAGAIDQFEPHCRVPMSRFQTLGSTLNY